MIFFYNWREKIFVIGNGNPSGRLTMHLVVTGIGCSTEHEAETKLHLDNLIELIENFAKPAFSLAGEASLVDCLPSMMMIRSLSMIVLAGVDSGRVSTQLPLSRGAM